MKYAIIEAGGKQYVAREGETIDVDRIPSDTIGDKGYGIRFCDKARLSEIDNGGIVTDLSPG